MELILSSFIVFERDDVNETKEILGLGDGIALFTSKDFAYTYLNDNVGSDNDFEERIINLEFFMDLSENGLDFIIEINPGTDIAYHLAVEDFIYIDEIYNSEEFKDYWRSTSTQYLKNAVKTVDNQSFLDCYDERLKLLADELLDKIEDVDNSDDVMEILRKSLAKTNENYENYTNF